MDKSIALKRESTAHPLVKVLVEARLKRNMSRSVLAYLSGYSLSTLAHWELGVRKMSMEAFLDIAEILDLEVIVREKESVDLKL